MAAFEAVFRELMFDLKIPLGRAFGVRFYGNAAFLCLLGLAAASGAAREASLVLAAIVLHEMAHLVVAAAFGIEVEEVEFLPFGAVARLSPSSLADPLADGIVAVAGPLNNLVMVGFFRFLDSVVPLDADLVRLFLDANAFLGLANLVPVLPLDGGRALRAVLSPRMGYAVATRKLAIAGKAAGAVALAVSILTGLKGAATPWLGGAGIFVFLAAERDSAFSSARAVIDMASKKEVLAKAGVLPVRQVVVPEDASLIEVVRRLHPGSYHLVLVAGEDLRIAGTLTEAEIAKAALTLGLKIKLREVTCRPGPKPGNSPGRPIPP